MRQFSVNVKPNSAMLTSIVVCAVPIDPVLVVVVDRGRRLRRDPTARAPVMPAAAGPRTVQR